MAIYTLKNSNRRGLLTVDSPSFPARGEDWKLGVQQRLGSLIRQAGVSAARQVILDSLSAVGQDDLLKLSANPANWAEQLVRHPLIEEILNQEIPEEITEKDAQLVTPAGGKDNAENQLELALMQAIAGKREQ